MPDPNWEENDRKNGRVFAGVFASMLKAIGAEPIVVDLTDKEPEIRDVELEGPKLLEVDFAKAEVATFAAVMSDQLPVIEVNSGNKAVDFAVIHAECLRDELSKVWGQEIKELEKSQDVIKTIIKEKKACQ